MPNQFNTKQISQPHHYSYPAQFDCGRCSRKRNLCQVVSGIFTRSTLPFGYSFVTPIPSGTCNITIFEASPSKNYFALRNKDKKFVLNGDWKIQAAGKYYIGGTVFAYFPSSGIEGEKLEAPGPITEPLDLMLLYQSPNPGIRYEYRIPLHDGSRTPPIIIPVQPLPSPPVNKMQSIPLNNLFLSDSSNIVANSFLHGPSQSAINKNYFDPSLVKNNIYQQGSSKDLGHKIKSSRNYYPAYNKSNIWRNYYVKQEHNTDLPFGAKVATGFHPSVNRMAHPTRLPNHISVEMSNSNYKSLDDKLLTNNFRTPIDNNLTLYHIGGGNHDSKYPTVNLISHQKIRHNHGYKKLLSDLSQNKKFYHTDRPSLNNIDKDIFQDNRLVEYAKKVRKSKKRKKVKKRKDRFQWIFKGLTECSRSCGGGEQMSVLACERRRKNRIVSDKRCHGLEKPEMNIISCNLKPCPAKWMPEDWSPCSVSCAVGIQTRTFVCKQEVSPSLIMTVPEGACLDEVAGESSQTCHLGNCPSKLPQWQTHSWSPCSKTCGMGVKRREVDCIVFLQKKNDSVCEVAGLFKPNQEDTCNMEECIQNTWMFNDWFDSCSNGCHDANQRARNVICYGSRNAAKNICDISLKPQESQPCRSNEECIGEWFVGTWSSCNVSCGNGKQVRAIQCLKKNKGKWEITDERYCSRQSKPLSFQLCERSACLSQWYSSEWSLCSCENNQRTRDVRCLQTEGYSSLSCNNFNKPDNLSECNEMLNCKHFSEDINNKTIQKEDHTERTEDQTSYPDYYLDTSPNTIIESSKNGEIPNGILIDNKLAEKDIQSSDIDLMIESEEIQNSIPRKDEPFSSESYSPSTANPKINGSKKSKIECMDRIKNCSLVFRARLCKLKYYRQLCCHTCGG